MVEIWLSQPRGAFWWSNESAIIRVCSNRGGELAHQNLERVAIRHLQPNIAAEVINHRCDHILQVLGFGNEWGVDIPASGGTWYHGKLLDCRRGTAAEGVEVTEPAGGVVTRDILPGIADGAAAGNEAACL